MTLIDTDAMNEVALQRNRALRSPSRETVRLIIVDIDTTQRANQQAIVGRDSQTRQKHMGQGSRSSGMMILSQLLQIGVITEQSLVGCDPDHIITF